MIKRFDGRYAFLSNFYPCEIEHQGISYKNVETYYVAMKIKNDQQIDGKYIGYVDCRELISKIKNPGDVKRFGRTLKIRKDWDDVKLDVMLWGVREKFKKEELKEMLLATGDQDLIEGNWWHDNFFGVCTCGPCQGGGQNNLGKIIMKVREEVKNLNKKPSLEDVLFPKNK
jgi:ribA/ribD-fused uncharacterized protein